MNPWTEPDLCASCADDAGDWWERPRLPCSDCGTDTNPWHWIGPSEYYMVTAEVWAAAGAPRKLILCIGCLETRLGRQLVAADFTEAGCNQPGFTHDSPRLAARRLA